MKKKNYLIVVFACFTLLYSCISKKIYDETNLKTQANKIASIYEKFYQNRYDYDENARDTILNRFKSTLLNTLSNNEYASVPFDSLSKSDRVTIIESKDKKLRIFSWDELNNGTWHVYNSAYQYNNKKQSYAGMLTSEIGSSKELVFDDIIHLKIFQLPKVKYLVVGYGTHGVGLEFYTFRLLSFINNKIVDCNNCFDNKNLFVFIKPRGDKAPIYDEELQTIAYPEYKKDNETGFLHKTEKLNVLKYKNNKFIKLK